MNTLIIKQKVALFGSFYLAYIYHYESIIKQIMTGILFDSRDSWDLETTPPPPESLE